MPEEMKQDAAAADRVLLILAAKASRIEIEPCLYIQTVLIDSTVIIEDDSFAPGMPTPVQMLRQHARLAWFSASAQACLSSESRSAQRTCHSASMVERPCW